MLVTLVILFVVGYMAIALEHPIKVDKTASALLLGMLMWVVYALNAEKIVPIVSGAELQEYIESAKIGGESLAHQCLQYVLNVEIIEHLGDITQTLFFLIGAMTIVELVDVHGGFSVITNKITTRKKRRLLWIICFVTFILSAVLDNLTTTIVMVMLLRKLISDQKERWLYAGMVVIAANTGGAWSPIGDVTTIMLWVKGNVTSGALISFVLLPSIVAVILPLLIVSAKLKGSMSDDIASAIPNDGVVTPRERKLIFYLGVGGLLFVPVFKSITHLPPFVGILLVLGALWVFTELFYNRKGLSKDQEHRLPSIISRIDMSSILFFLGILMAVAVLQATGILASAASWLDAKVHNVYIINILLGILSSIVDNVPLVAAAMGMYPVEAAGATGYAANFVVDGTFWEFLSYCAGVGGSMLIIGSAAGVIAMGLEKISFGWYLKRFTLLALVGYLAGAAVYILEAEVLKPMFGL
ncbi:MAG: sodium:proton antiporter NhaD [Bacteroides sp.]|nr:sodium:proton antiporter NhaD [Lachnospiraceae bacterium]MCM1331549.1 sodium:proton antiporter NhaD [Bacteroides sp.]MCM1388740.1 sodium:proton antiporter NhaD [Bacteroides sp.]